MTPDDLRERLESKRNAIQYLQEWAQEHISNRRELHLVLGNLNTLSHDAEYFLLWKLWLAAEMLQDSEYDYGRLSLEEALTALEQA